MRRDTNTLIVMEFIILIVIYIVLLSITPGMARKRGRSAFGWFVFSLFFTPFSNIILLLVGKTDEKKREEFEEQARIYSRYLNQNSRSEIEEKKTEVM